MADSTIPPRDLGGGLLLRRATAADTEAVVELNASLHRWPEPALPNRRVAAWTRTLFSGEHPTSGLGDFLVVEETGGGAAAGPGGSSPPSACSRKPGPTTASPSRRGSRNWSGRCRSIVGGA